MSEVLRLELERIERLLAAGKIGVGAAADMRRRAFRVFGPEDDKKVDSR